MEIDASNWMRTVVSVSAEEGIEIIRSILSQLLESEGKGCVLRGKGEKKDETNPDFELRVDQKKADILLRARAVVLGQCIVPFEKAIKEKSDED